MREGDCNCFGDVFDCANVCGGNAEPDVCGVCNGNGVPSGDCDCFGNKLDCEGTCGGPKILGICGDCLLPYPGSVTVPVEIGGEMTICLENYAPGACDCDGNFLDCAGVCGGNQEVDECGECGGFGIAPGYCDCDFNTLDCDGNCGGDDELDICGVCNGPGIPSGFCDCDGTEFDECGVCGGPGVVAPYCDC